MEKKHPGKIKSHLIKETYSKIKTCLYENKLFHLTGIPLYWDVFLSYKHFVPLCKDVFLHKNIRSVIKTEEKLMLLTNI